MNDKELLELAARAIGLTLRYNYLGGRDANQPWNPLDDDGDALRLAVRLGLQVSQGKRMDGEAVAYAETAIDRYIAPHGADPYAATRRAIVRAAAEIGRNMK